MISAADKKLLRELALRVAAHAADPIQEQKKKLWTLHNDLKTNEPLIFIDPENGWNEIFPQSALLCTDPLARDWEFQLRIRLFHAEHLKDDFVVDDTFGVPIAASDDGWGVQILREGGHNNGAYHVTPAIEDYEEDFCKLHFPKLTLDDAASARLMETAQETFGDILNVRRYASWWWSLGLTNRYIDLRGLENFLCDFVLEPEWVHKMMDFLGRGTLAQIDFLEQNGCLFSNNGNRYVGSGGFGFTNDLPEVEGSTVTQNMWGFAESQETSSISPQMYAEFIFPYHKRILERFGLNCYGCCEAFESRWAYISQIPRLRRVSCSPWSDPDAASELLGSRYISSHKPSPTPLASANMDEDSARKNLRAILRHAPNTVQELIMKDNHTLGGNPYNAVRWVELAREEIGNI